MISSIEITRFRGIREGKLEDLTPLVVLVGPNGCGKSSILDAMFIAASPSPQNAAKLAVKRHKGLKRPARWFLWRADDTKATAIALATMDHEIRRFHIQVTGAQNLHCVDDPPAGPGVQFRFLSGELEGIPEVRLVEPRAFEMQPPLHELYTQTVVQGRREEANAIINAVVPGAEHLEILTDGNEPVVHVVFKDHSIPIAMAGDGVYALVRLSVELASRPQGIVLVEEPEVHQHPGAIRQTVRAILTAVRRNIQVILTTHSLELIDSILAESSEKDLRKLSLYRLRLEDGTLLSARMPGSDVQFERCEIENDLR